MYCTECGKKNHKQSRLCWNCGTNISQYISSYQKNSRDLSSVTNRPQKISKPFFLGSIAVGLVLGQLLRVLTWGTVNPLQTLASFMSLYGTVVLLILIYRMWDSVQDGYARTSPGKAVGFLFIPLFNLYWIFQAVWGFSQDFNRYISRYGLNIKPLPENLFMAVIVLPLVAVVIAAMAAEYYSGFLFVISLLAYLAHLVLMLVIVDKVCDGVNSIHMTGEQP